MAVKLRLTRRGKKKQPTYRVVAADSRSPRDGRFIEILGFYDPRPEPSEIRIDSEKALKWLKSGAQPSERVKKLLEITGVWSQFTGKITVAESAKSVEPNPEPEVESAISEPTPEPVVSESSDPEPPAPEPTPEPKAETKVETKAEAEPEPETEPEVEAEAEPDPKVSES